MNKGLLTSRRIREWREYLTAYLMIAPATILIFTFGIFPVGFALYVSLHKWRLVRGDFIGLGNYTQALDSGAYILVFGLALGLLYWAFRLIRQVLDTAKEFKDQPWWMILPGLLFAVTTLSLGNWLYKALPEFLDIAKKIIGVEKTRELFVQLLDEAFHVEQVFAAWKMFLWLLIASIVVLIAMSYLGAFKNNRNIGYTFKFNGMMIAAILGTGLLWVTYQAIAEAYTIAFENNEDPGIWPQLITVSAGVILLYVGWKLWQNTVQQTSDRRFIFQFLGVMTLLVGAWLLIGEIPTIVASGDEDLWEGLKVTVFYSLGTVPFQLTFSLFLAILLFQKLWGSELFRMLFFLPYVTPTVASAAIFRQLFSNRYQAPINQLLIKLGFEPLQWIRESKGIFTMMAQGLNLTIPDWAAGPSLALVVIMIYSIWTYVGYDTVIYLAGLGNISMELVEAAEIDGAGKWAIFRHITLPLLSPTTYFLSLLAIIGTFKAFGHIWVLRQGGTALGTTDTFSVAIFSEFFEKTKYGYASALAFVLFAVILSLTYINNKVQGSRVFYG